jgi:hypothetical protein
LENQLGLDHFMGLTPITSEVLHQHHVWGTFFHYNEIHTSFWAYIIHHYSIAYIPCLSRLVHYGHDKEFKTHHYKDEEEGIELCVFIDAGKELDGFKVPSEEMILESLNYKNNMRMNRDATPIVFNIRKS